MLQLQRAVIRMTDIDKMIEDAAYTDSVKGRRIMIKLVLKAQRDRYEAAVRKVLEAKLDFSLAAEIGEIMADIKARLAKGQ